MPILIGVKIFVNYTYVYLSLGPQHAISYSFNQWKSILLISLISVELLLIPLIGILGLIIFNLIVPVKIILDTQK